MCWEVVLNFHCPLADLLLGGSLEAISWAWHSSKLRTAIRLELLPAHLLKRLVERNIWRLQLWCTASRDEGHTRVVLWKQVHDLIGAVCTESVHHQQWFLATSMIQVDLFDPSQHEGAIHPSLLLNTDYPSPVSERGYLKKCTECTYIIHESSRKKRVFYIILGETTPVPY